MSNTKNTGGPAFPGNGEQFVEGPHGIQPQGAYGMQGSEGMTLRDYFAAKATIDGDISQEYAEKLLGRPMPNWVNETAANAEFWSDFEAKVKFIKADAMLKAREQ